MNFHIYVLCELAVNGSVPLAAAAAAAWLLWYCMCVWRFHHPLWRLSCSLPCSLWRCDRVPVTLTEESSLKSTGINNHWDTHNPFFKKGIFVTGRRKKPTIASAQCGACDSRTAKSLSFRREHLGITLYTLSPWQHRFWAWVGVQVSFIYPRQPTQTAVCMLGGSILAIMLKVHFITKTAITLLGAVRVLLAGSCCIKMCMCVEI